MDPYEKWRREVNIILMDTVGFSLGELEAHIEENVRKLYEDGEDPMYAAQYAAGEVDPVLDIEQIILDRPIPQAKPKKKKK